MLIKTHHAIHKSIFIQIFRYTYLFASLCFLQIKFSALNWNNNHNNKCSKNHIQNNQVSLKTQQKSTKHISFTIYKDSLSLFIIYPLFNFILNIRDISYITQTPLKFLGVVYIVLYALLIQD
jgi:hypothetical protein